MGEDYDDYDDDFDDEEEESSAPPVGFLDSLQEQFGAAPWWVILVTPGAVRHWHRHKRGWCVNCGYDLAGLEAGTACPECGS